MRQDLQGDSLRGSEWHGDYDGYSPKKDVQFDTMGGSPVCEDEETWGVDGLKDFDEA